MNFFKELKRRNVIKETIAYIVVAWVFLQVTSLVLTIFEAPSWVSKTLLIILAMGLPVWILFSWAYQVTPEGFKKTETISEEQVVTVASNKRLDILIVIALLLAIAVTFINKPTPNIVDKTMVTNTSARNNSIAVLPFDDNSPGKDQDWFTVGMTEALIAELSKISSLIVPSHQSVKKYKGTTKTLPEIAMELNVGSVIVGTASKVNDSIRIRAQLLSANDKPLWGESYDEGFGHALQLQHNIAKAITKEINIVLTPADSARFTMPAGVNPKALETDMKGVHILSWFDTLEDLEMATEYFKRAINIDSTFAMAYAHLAYSYLYYPHMGGKNNLESMELAEELNNKALQLDPNLTLAYLNRFYYLYYYKWDWDEGLSALNKAEQLEPNNPDLLEKLYMYNIVSGKFDKAFEVVNKMRQIAPSSRFYWYSKAMIQFHSRDLEGSLKTIEEGLELYPDFYGLLELRSWCLSVLGRHEEAVSSYKKYLSFMGGSSTLSEGIAGFVFARAGLKEEALKQLDIVGGPGVAYCDPVIIGAIYMGLGDKDKAMEYFQQGYREHSLQMLFLKRAPTYDPMRGDPRFQKLIQDLKFP